MTNSLAYITNFIKLRCSALWAMYKLCLLPETFTVLCYMLKALNFGQLLNRVLRELGNMKQLEQVCQT